MFGLQIQELVRQLRGQIPDLAVNAIESSLGNAFQELQHRGPTTITIDGNYHPGSGTSSRGKAIPRNCSGDALAAVTVSNSSGRFEDATCITDCVINGLALRTVGPSHLDSARIETLYVDNLLDECGDPIEDDITEGGVHLCKFVITDEEPNALDLSYAIAKQIVWNGTSYVALPAEFIVVDFTATREFSRRWRNGYYGWCVFKADRDTITHDAVEYDCRECIWVESKARYIEYITIEPMSAQEADAMVIYSWGSTAHVPPSTVVSIHDRMNKIPDVLAGYRGIAIYDETTREYIALSEDSAGTVIPRPEALYALRIDDGIRAANCLYSGHRIDMVDVVGGMCESNFTDLDEIWITAPNYSLDIYPGSYHWGLMIDPAFDVDGDVRPLYTIKAEPADMLCLFIPEGTVMDGDCLFAGSLIEPDVSAVYGTGGDADSACEITTTTIAAIRIYLPNRGECDTVKKDTFLMGFRTAYGGGAGDIFTSDYELHDTCAPINAVGHVSTGFDCDDAGMFGDVDSYPGVGFHLEEDPDPPIFMPFKNQFGLCGKSGDSFWGLPDNDLGEEDNLIQVSRTCYDVFVQFGPSGQCDFNGKTRTMPLMTFGDPVDVALDMSFVCFCPCDNEECRCPNTGDVVQGTFTYTQKLISGPDVTTTQTFNLTFIYNAPDDVWEADFQCEATENVLMYEVEYSIDGGENEFGWAQIGCNWDRDDVIAVYDDDEVIIPGANVINFTGEVYVSEMLMTCTRYYRIEWACYDLNELGDGTFSIVDNGVVIYGLAPPGYDKNGITAGMPITDVESLSDAITSVGCRSVAYSASGAEEFGISVTPDFLTLSLCGFRTFNSIPALDGTFGVGTISIAW